MVTPGTVTEVVLSKSPLYLAGMVAACIGLGVFAAYFRILNRKGSVAAAIIGLIIGITADLSWFVLLLIFLGSNYLVTIARTDYKRSRGLMEGNSGERGLANVLANGIVPTFVAFIAVYMESDLAAVLYITALCGVTADTFASELGILSEKVYLITNFKKVEPGVDGGISGLGEACSFLGSVIPAAAGFFFIGRYSADFLSFPLHPIYFLLPFLAGVVVCHVDSLLGATIQRRGYVSNSGVNLLSLTVVSLAVWLLFLFDVL